MTSCLLYSAKLWWAEVNERDCTFNASELYPSGGFSLSVSSSSFLLILQMLTTAYKFRPLTDHFLWFNRKWNCSWFNDFIYASSQWQWALFINLQWLNADIRSVTRVSLQILSLSSYLHKIITLYINTFIALPINYFFYKIKTRKCFIYCYLLQTGASVDFVTRRLFSHSSVEGGKFVWV